MENKFRAVRYGLEDKPSGFGRQAEIAECDLIVEYLELSMTRWMSWKAARRLSMLARRAKSR